MFPSKPHHYQHWYIACTAQALKEKPISRTVLGLPLVLFRGSKDQPVALLDRCPHRNVPLSQGQIYRAPPSKIADDTSHTHLTCRYHGWQFNEQGQCQHIPGLGSIQPDQSNRNATRNAIAYPTAEQQGFIWVYPSADLPADSSVDSSVDSFANFSANPFSHTQPYTFPYLDHPHFATTRWQIQANATLLNAAENFLDATHTHFVHAGLIRSDQQRQPVTVKITRRQRSVEAVYSGEQQLSGLLSRLLVPGCRELTSIGRFILPAIAQIEYKTDRHYRLLVSLFITPNTAQQLTAYCVVTFRWGSFNRLGRLLAKPLFYPAMQQDLAILNAQTQNINRFKQEKFTYTELDLLRPHIEYLIDQPTPPANPAKEKDQTPLFETTISVQL